VLPRDEVCDDVDDDCDGTVDDGVLDVCNTCGPCASLCAGPADGCEDWREEEVTRGIVETPQGHLTLDAPTLRRHLVWPSSDVEGKIFRVDADTQTVLGAYWASTGHGDVLEPDQSRPSSTAIDREGNAIVANREMPWSTITKIAADPASCPDRNGNGRIDTSTGWNDVLPFDAINAWQDECILWHTPLPGGWAVPVVLYAATVLDGAPSELAWVGLHLDERLVELDPETGSLTGRALDVPDFLLTDGAVDRDGWVWLVGTWQAGRFHVDDPAGTWETISGFPYHSKLRWIAIDENDAPWFAGRDLFRLDRDTFEVSGAGLEEYPSHPVADGQGSIWAGTCSQNPHVFRVEASPNIAWHTVQTPDTYSLGMAADFDGRVWTFGWPVTSGDVEIGSTSIIDVATENVDRVLDDCDGGDCVRYPDVAGDLTGLQRHVAATAGAWSRVFEGCAGSGSITWTALHVDAQTPAGARLVVSARSSDDARIAAVLPDVELGVVPDVGVEFDLRGALPEAGRFLHVRLDLRADRGDVAPVIRGVTVDFSCLADIE
jgi:hypothetical protein